MAASAHAADMPAPAPTPAPTPAAQPAPSSDFDYRFGDVEVKIKGADTLGTSIRTVAPNPSLIPPLNGPLVGIVGKANGGANSADGDLNYAKGQPVSTVAKGFLSVDVGTNNVGVFVRGKYWYDETLENQVAPWGNIATGYLTGRPLNDGPFDNAGKFANVALGEAYLYGKGTVGGVPVEGRIGNINVPWGLPTLVPGGLLNAVNAIDLNAFYRPDPQPEEILQPSLGAFGTVGVTKNLNLQGFWKFQGAHNDLLECGTFYSLNDYSGTGCNEVVFGPFSNPTALANGYFINRDLTPQFNAANFGLGGNYRVDALSTTFGLYYAHVDSTSNNTSVMMSQRALATPFVPNNPGGLNGSYFIEYVPNVDVFSANFQTKLNATTLYGEYVYKPDAPVQLNAVDLLNGLVSAVAPTPLRASMNAAAPGGIYNGYERLELGNLTLGGSQAIPGVLGAKALVLNAEGAFKQVYDLPDPSVARFGRSDIFGQGPVNGVCPAPQGPLQCTNDGYVSSTAWGYRLKAALQFENVFGTKLAVTPSVGISDDVQGWSADGVISQGRVLLNLGLHAEYEKRYFADATWNPALVTGPYDSGSDRQVFTVATGIRF